MENFYSSYALMVVAGFVPCFVVAWLAARRGRGAGWFLASLLLVWAYLIGPLLVLLLLATREPLARCPECRASIPAAAHRCQHCGSELALA